MWMKCDLLVKTMVLMALPPVMMACSLGFRVNPSVVEYELAGTWYSQRPSMAKLYISCGGRLEFEKAGPSIHPERALTGLKGDIRSVGDDYITVFAILTKRLEMQRRPYRKDGKLHMVLNGYHFERMRGGDCVADEVDEALPDP